MPASLLNRAIEAFAAGDVIAIDLVLEQIENVPDSTGADLVMVAYMRGSLARWSVNPVQAYQHYARAARLAPKDRKSLEQAGYTAYITEQALSTGLAVCPEDHPFID